jgi:hypothetical protein
MSTGPSHITFKYSNDHRVVPKNRTWSISPEDLLLLREAGANEQPDWCLRTAAELTLRLGPWADNNGQATGVNEFASLVRGMFDHIPQHALVLDSAASELETIKFSVRVCLALMVFAAMGGRRDLQYLIRSVHKLMVAIDERTHGFDEPLLQVSRSSKSAREDRYAKCVKTWCAMAGHSLVAMGVPKRLATARVADVVNKNEFLPPKRSGVSVVPRSVMNWMTRWDNGDLKFMGDADTEFRDAFDNLNKGYPLIAQRKVLTLLAKRLTERRKFQLFPQETSAVL